MKTAHLFAGGGGGLLADLILGHKPIYAVDNDELTSKHLERRRDWFPDLEVFCADVGTFDATGWQGRVDILHAGIPCPRRSSARRGRGETYDGWPDTLRIIGECRPATVFLECVPAFIREHERMETDLERAGYGLSRPLVTDAAALGAPHSRRRYWALGIAHDHGEPVCRLDAEAPILPPPDAGDWWEADPRDLRMDDGLADKVHRFRMTGNGQVPLQAAAAYLLLGGMAAINELYS